MINTNTSRRRTMRARLGVAPLCLAWVAVGALGSTSIGAQADSLLSVVEALTTALEHNPDVRIARAATDRQRGTMVQARAPFDPRPSAALTNTRTVRSGSSDITNVIPAYSSFTSGSNVSLEKLFRSGILASSTLSMTRQSPVLLDGPTLNQLAATSTVTVPLSQGRGGGVYTATERAANEGHEASVHDLRATASAALLNATVAYWQYRAAFERAEIQRAAADRSQRAVDEVAILIRADERPRSEMDLMVANAASKRVARMQAEQQIVTTRFDLGLAIGLGADAAAALQSPGTPLPPPAGPEQLPIQAMIADTLARHEEIAAAVRRQEGSRLLRDAAVSQLQPRVDLMVGVGFTGQLGGANVSHLFGTFNNLLGPNASMQIVYAPSSVDSRLRGEVIEADAAYTQAVINAETVARTIAVKVAAAAAELASSRAQLRSTEEAVARSRLALATVERTFELGTATVFDRILAEDTVTNAELADLASRAGYAVALAKLQFARAVLVDVHGDELRVDPQRVMRISLGETP